MITREIFVSNNECVINRSRSSIVIQAREHATQKTVAKTRLNNSFLLWIVFRRASRRNALPTLFPHVGELIVFLVSLTLTLCALTSGVAEAATVVSTGTITILSGSPSSPVLVSGNNVHITAAAGSVIPCITVSGIINSLTITSTGGTFVCPTGDNIVFDTSVTSATDVKIGGDGVAMTSTSGHNINFAGVTFSNFLVTFGANGATFSSFTAGTNLYSNFLMKPTATSYSLQMTFQSTTLSAKRYNLYVQSVMSSDFAISTAATVSLSVTSSGSWDTANVYLYACAGGGSGSEAHVTLGGVSIVGQVDTNTAYSGNLVMRLSKYIIAQLDAGITTLKFTSTAAAAPTFFYGGNAVIAERCTGLGLSIMSSMTFVATSRAASYGGANVYIDATATATITAVSLYHSATLSNIAMVGDKAFANFVFAGTIQGLTFGAGGGSTTTLSMIGGAALPLYNVYGATTLSITASSMTFNPVVVSAANVNFLFNHAVPTATPVFFLDDFTIKMNNGGSVEAGRSLIQAVNPFRFLTISSTNVVFSLTTTSYIFVHFNTAKNTIAKSVSGNAYFDGCTLLSNIRYIAFTYHVDGGTFTFTKTGQTGTAPMDFGALPASLSIPDFASAAPTPKGIFSFVTAFTPGSANLAVVLSVAGGITVTSAGNTRSLFHVENAAPNIWVYAQDLITIQGTSLITFPSGSASGTYTFTMQATPMVELRVPDANIIDVGIANVVVGGTFTFTSLSTINVYSKSLLYSIGEAQSLTISGVSTNFHLTAEAVTLYGLLQQSGSLSLVNSPVTCSRAFFSSQCVAGTSCSNYVDVTATSSNILVTTTSNIASYLVQATSMTTYGGNFKFYTGSILYSSTATPTYNGFYFTGTTFIGQTLIQNPTATIAVNKNFFYFDAASPIGRLATNPRLEITSATITCTLTCFSFNAAVMNAVFLWDKTKIYSSSTGGDYGVYFGNTVSVSSVRFEGSLLSPVEVTATGAGVYFSQQATSVTTTFQNAYITVTGAATTYDLYMLSCLNPAATGDCVLSFGGVNDFRSSANTANIGQNVKIGAFVGTVVGYSSSLNMQAPRENFVITANSGWVFQMSLGSGVITTTSTTLNNIEISGVNLAGNYVDLEGTTIIGPNYNVLLSASACDVTMNGVSLTTSAVGSAANNVLVTYSSAFALFGMLTIQSSTFLGTAYSSGIPLYNNVYVYYGISSASPSSIVGTTFNGANFGIQIASILSTPLTLTTTTANCVLRSTAAPTRMGLLLAGTVGNAPVNTGAYTVSISSVTTIGTVVGGNLGSSCYQTHALWAGTNANHDITLSGARYGWSQSYKSLTFVGLEFLNARLGDGTITTMHNLLVKGVGAQFDYYSPAKALRSTATSNGAFSKMAITITCISMATTEFPIDIQSTSISDVLSSSTVQIASVYFSITPVAVYITGKMTASSLTFRSVSFHTNKMLWYNALNALGSPTLAVTSACSTFNDGVVTTANAYVVTNLGALSTAFSTSLCDTDADRRQCYATATKSQSTSFSQSRTPSQSGSSSQSLSRELSQTKSASTTRTHSVSQTTSTSTSSSQSTSHTSTQSYTYSNSMSNSLTTTHTESITFSNEVSKSNTISLSRSQSPSSTVSQSDEKSVTRSSSFSASSSQSTSLTQSLSLSSSLSQSYSYTLSSSETESDEASVTATRSQSVTLRITPSRTLSVSVSLSQSHSRSESQSLSASPSKSSSSSSSLTDERSVSESSSNSFSMSDSLSNEVSASRTPTLSSSLTNEETSSETLSMTITQIRTLTLTEEKTMSATRSRSPSLSDSLSDEASESKTSSLSPSKTGSLSEERSLSRSLTLSESFSDTPSLSLSDTVTISVSSSDSPSRSASKELSASKSSSSSFSNTASLTTQFSESLSESSSSSDTPSQTTELSRSGSKSATIDLSQSWTSSFTEDTSASRTSSATLSNTSTLSSEKTLTNSSSPSATAQVSWSDSWTPTTTDTLSPTASDSGSHSDSLTQEVSTSVSSNTSRTHTGERSASGSVSASQILSGTMSRMTPTAQQSSSVSFSEVDSTSFSQSWSDSKSWTTDDTKTLTGTESISSEPSRSLSPTTTHEQSQSVSWSISESPSDSSSLTLSDSGSESVSFSLSDSISPEVTLSPTSSESYSQSDTVSLSDSNSVSDSSTSTETESQSTSETSTPTLSDTKELTASLTSSRSRSEEESRSYSLSVSQSNEASRTRTTSFSEDRSHSIGSHTFSLTPTTSSSLSMSQATRSPTLTWYQKPRGLTKSESRYTPSTSKTLSLSDTVSSSVTNSTSKTVTLTEDHSLTHSASLSRSESREESASDSVTISDEFTTSMTKRTATRTYATQTIRITTSSSVSIEDSVTATATLTVSTSVTEELSLTRSLIDTYSGSDDMTTSGTVTITPPPTITPTTTMTVPLNPPGALQGLFGKYLTGTRCDEKSVYFSINGPLIIAILVLLLARGARMELPWRVDTYDKVPMWRSLAIQHLYVAIFLPCHLQCYYGHFLMLFTHTNLLMLIVSLFVIVFPAATFSQTIFAAVFASIVCQGVRPLANTLFFRQNFRRMRIQRRVRDPEEMLFNMDDDAATAAVSMGGSSDWATISEQENLSSQYNATETESLPTATPTPEPEPESEDPELPNGPERELTDDLLNASFSFDEDDFHFSGGTAFVRQAQSIRGSPGPQATRVAAPPPSTSNALPAGFMVDVDAEFLVSFDEEDTAPIRVVGTTSSFYAPIEGDKAADALARSTVAKGMDQSAFGQPFSASGAFGADTVDSISVGSFDDFLEVDQVTTKTHKSNGKQGKDTMSTAAGGSIGTGTGDVELKSLWSVDTGKSAPPLPPPPRELFWDPRRAQSEKSYGDGDRIIDFGVKEIPSSSEGPRKGGWGDVKKELDDEEGLANLSLSSMSLGSLLSDLSSSYESGAEEMERNVRLRFSVRTFYLTATLVVGFLGLAAMAASYYLRGMIDETIPSCGQYSFVVPLVLAVDFALGQTAFVLCVWAHRVMKSSEGARDTPVFSELHPKNDEVRTILAQRGRLYMRKLKDSHKHKRELERLRKEGVEDRVERIVADRRAMKPISDHAQIFMSIDEDEARKKDDAKDLVPKSAAKEERITKNNKYAEFSSTSSSGDSDGANARPLWFKGENDWK